MILKKYCKLLVAAGALLATSATFANRFYCPTPSQLNSSATFNAQGELTAINGITMTSWGGPPIPKGSSVYKVQAIIFLKTAASKGKDATYMFGCATFTRDHGGVPFISVSSSAGQQVNPSEWSREGIAQNSYVCPANASEESVNGSNCGINH